MWCERKGKRRLEGATQDQAQSAPWLVQVGNKKQWIKKFSYRQEI